MVAIRFQRIGKPKMARFRLVAVESTRGPATPPIEVLAAYNPEAKDGEKLTNVKKEKLEKWLKNGAQLSDSAKRMLIKEKVIAGTLPPPPPSRPSGASNVPDPRSGAPKPKASAPADKPAEPPAGPPAVKTS
ncbi:MAG: 30S ribosomal protein S16 [Elusimicrobia bacterium]|nr:30S ribosomal protein S16 [Elusimicrobiota bacterium]